MRKIEKVINVYKFDELNESVKRKVLDDRMEIEKNDYCNYCLESDMTEKAKELLDEHFKNATFEDTYYSLSYCQGDGAMITFSIDIENFNKKYHIFDDEEMRYIKDYDIIDKIEVVHIGRYYHKYAFDVNVCYSDSYWQYSYGDIEYNDIKDDYNISKSDFDSIDERLCKATSRDSKFYQDVVDMNSELEKFGYSCIDYYNYEDNVLEFVRGAEYLEDGSVYYE